ncbi:MAG: signal peptidase II [Candidatus Omnitrophica bacterium]|nr:signal peptidase II [Candidatus Omnitrophota bacterium]
MTQILLLSLGIILLDQGTKFLVVRTLSGSPSVPILPGVFHLTYLRNPGVAFGLFSGYSFPIALATTAVVVGLLFSAVRGQGSSRWNNLALGLIFGGAVGNLIDRVRVGGVIDFLDFRIWPVFNVADSCITIGAVLIAWNLLRRR